MFFVFLLWWIVLNGRVTWEIVITGAVISGAIYLFMCRFMGLTLRRDLKRMQCIPLLVEYFVALVIEIVKANLAMLPYLFSTKVLPEPALVVFEADLKSASTQMLFANSITMTPGTITVEMIDGIYMVHCFDKSMGDGLSDSVILKILKRMEEVAGSE